MRESLESLLAEEIMGLGVLAGCPGLKDTVSDGSQQL